MPLRPFGYICPFPDSQKVRKVSKIQYYIVENQFVGSLRFFCRLLNLGPDFKNQNDQFIMAKEKENSNLFDYTEDSIRSLDWREHIRLRPGMYIGKLGDGASPDDGIYVLLKEVLDNCIDEHTMGYGKQVDITLQDKTVTVRDYGRGIPLGKVVDVVSKINTGAKYDSKAFQKSVGLNGVGTKAVNALSNYFKVTAFRDGKEKTAEFERGVLTKEHKEIKTDEPNGTRVIFTPDDTVFKNSIARCGTTAI